MNESGMPQGHGEAAADVDCPLDRQCCTMVVQPGESIQQAIDALPPVGGCVCLKSGVHQIDTTILIQQSNVILHGEAPGTRVVAIKPVGSMVTVVGGKDVVKNVEITHITFDYAQEFEPPDGPSIIGLIQCQRIRIIHCELLYTNPADMVLINGITLAHADDVCITDNLFDRMFAGVWAHDYASAVLVADNTIRGKLIETDSGNAPHGWLGVLLGLFADGIVRDNVFENFTTAVEAIGVHVEVIGNHIRRFPFPAKLDDAPDVDNLNFAIVAYTQQPARIHGNDIDLPSKSYGGIRVGRWNTSVTDNIVGSTYGTPSLIGPVGIYVGHDPSHATAGDFTLIGHNRFTGIQTGILVWDRPQGVLIADNHFSYGKGLAIGIKLDHCTEASVHDNVLIDQALPFWLIGGRRNRLHGNRASHVQIAAFISGEAELDFDGNIFDDVALLGIACENLRSAARFANSRVAHCGYKSSTLAMSLVMLQSNASAITDVAIENCDIVETGVAPNGSTTAGVAWGVASRFISHLKISDNRIRYPFATPLTSANEHRALKLFGMPALTVPVGKEVTEVAFGAALVSGNVFQGPSASRLVDIRRLVLTHQIDLHFEKLTFSTNRCDHFGKPGPTNITADIYGSQMIVTSNQVKTPLKGHSFGFGNRKKVATTSNYTTGDYINVGSTVPTPIPSFNVIV